MEVEQGAREMPNDALRRPPKFDDVPDLDAAVSLLVCVGGGASVVGAHRPPAARGQRDDIKALVHGRPSRLDGTGWRSHLAGDGLHQLLEGKAVIRLADGGRHLKME